MKSGATPQPGTEIKHRNHKVTASAQDSIHKAGLDETSIQAQAKSRTRWLIYAVVSGVLLVAVLAIADRVYMDRQDKLGQSDLAQAQVASIHNQVNEAEGRGQPLPSQLVQAQQRIGRGPNRPAQRQPLLLEPPDDSFLYDANIPAAERKILWQKMKKQRSRTFGAPPPRLASGDAGAGPP